MRLLENVLDVVTDIWGRDRVGVRLSPLGQASDISDSDPEALFSVVYKMLSARQLAHLHVLEQFPGNKTSDEDEAMMKRLRQHYDGFFISNGGYDAEKSVAALASGHAQAVTIGRPFIANPDLPERYRVGAKLNAPDQDTFYGGDETGYTDYPFLDGPAQ